MNDFICDELNEHIKVAKLLENLNGELIESVKLCVECLKNDGKILLFGNGGSAADAQHIAAELVGRYKLEREGLPAIALTTDSSTLTSISNDYGFSNVFVRQVKAIAKKGDVVIGISTSGTSENVVNALQVASSLGCITIALSGQNAEKVNKISDITLAVPSLNTPRIQEMHILIGHTICGLIDRGFTN